MFYLENYGDYSELIKNKHITIDMKTINRNTWQMHYQSLLNIMKDGIETEYMRHPIITLHFDVIDVDMAIPDVWFNMMLWYVLVAVDKEIRPCDIVFEEDGTTGNTIKRFMDDKFIDNYRTMIDNVQMNNIIDDCMYTFRHIDDFSFYIANTVSLDDFVELMDKNPEFYDLMHADLSHLPIDQVKIEGTKLANRSIEIIKNSDHCMSNYFLAGEGINPKQYKELAIHIGPKPNGLGGVFPTIINHSYINGGVKDPMDYAIEASTGRLAQIIVEGNVGTAGDFARLLGLNCMDTTLHKDPNYICDTKHFQEVTITERTFKLFLNRYFRFRKDGLEYKITKKMKKDLIGKTILLRSPMTCASAARGEGICYRCYGDLAYTNKDINPGRLSSEELSSRFTQMMLSAKHLLEASIRKIIWSKDFWKYFDVEYNIITLKDDFDYTGYSIKINLEDITLERDTEEISEGQYNEYITSFKLICPDGDEVVCNTANADNLYIANSISSVMQEYEKSTKKLKGVYSDGEDIIINLNLIQERDGILFVMNILNSDLSSNLKRVKDIINKIEITKNLSRHELLEKFNEGLLDSKINLQSVHAEVILMNQMRSDEDILGMPKWENQNPHYQILTLMQSLENIPYVTKRLSYAKTAQALRSPVTYRCEKPSAMDVFYMINPQKYINSKIVPAKEPEYAEKGLRKIWNKIDKNKDEEE